MKNLKLALCWFEIPSLFSVNQKTGFADNIFHRCLTRYFCTVDPVAVVNAPTQIRINAFSMAPTV
jgi:hypothetical protein